MTWAQEPQISISSQVDNSRVYIGDLITYTVTVTHDKDVKVELPGLGANLGGFEIRDYNLHEPKKKDGLITSAVDYTISTFFTGEFEIPPLTVMYYTPEDTAAKTLSTEKIKIVVESVKPSEAGDIKDIKPPVEIPRDLWHLMRWFVLGGVLALLAFLVFVIYRRKKAGKLDRLRDSDLLENGRIKEFYTEISEIIREYIEGRYFIVAMEMTTTEVLEGLSTAELSEDNFHLFQTFLEQSDLVKFAKRIPSEDENEAILNMAYEIVNRTKVLLEEILEESSGEEPKDRIGGAETEEGGSPAEPEMVSVESGNRETECVFSLGLRERSSQGFRDTSAECSLWLENARTELPCPCFCPSAVRYEGRGGHHPGNRHRPYDGYLQFDVSRGY